LSSQHTLSHARLHPNATRNNISGLSAGVCEEVARYLMYRYWIVSRGDRRFQVGVLLGSGHGGCEAMIVGIVMLLTLCGMLDLRGRGGGDSNVEAIVEKYWSTRDYVFLLGFVERVTAMTFHTGASILVLQVFRLKSCVWLLLAVLFHTLLDTLAVVESFQAANPVFPEFMFGLFVFPLVAWILTSFSGEESAGMHILSSEVPLFQDSSSHNHVDEIEDLVSVRSDSEVFATPNAENSPSMQVSLGSESQSDLVISGHS
jgi:YhfC intramembrane metalloprotease